MGKIYLYTRPQKYRCVSDLPSLENFEIIDLNILKTPENIYTKLIELEEELGKGLYLPETGSFIWTVSGEVTIVSLPKAHPLQ